MPAPHESFKLPRGMGRLVRYTANGLWTWQRWENRLNKWVNTATNESNRSRAEQYAFQQAAIRNGEKFRYQGVNILFTTVADEYVQVRTVGRGCKKLRPSSIQKLKTAINAFENYAGDGYERLQIDQIDSALLGDFVEREAIRITADSANRNLDFIEQILDFAHKRHYILHLPKVERAFQILANDGGDSDYENILGWPCPTPEEVRLILAHTAPQKVATGKQAYNGSGRGRAVYKGINGNDYTDLYAAICLTGMRLGEARFLTWDDVDLAGKIILIRHGMKNGIRWQPKTRSSVRRIAIVPELEVILKRLRKQNRKNKWVFETRRGTQLSADNPTKRLGEICDGLGFEKHYVLHSLRKYWASTVAQQGMDWKVMLKMFGHSDFELILSTYYAQNDDARLFAETSKIDFGLGLPQTA